jgi:hypothetical protein
MTESERQAVGLELASWLHSILAGAPGSAARFVSDRLQDEVGEPRATELRRQWAARWLEEREA